MAYPLVSLRAALGGAESFEDLAERAAEACAMAVDAEICTIWRIGVDEGDKRGLRLAGSYGIAQPATLAQEVTYAITPGASEFDGVTSYVGSTQRTVLVHSFQELKSQYGFCHKGKMDHIQWVDEPANRMRSLYAVPLMLGAEIQGVLKVENRRGQDGFSAEDVATVDAISEQIALAAKALVLLDSHERRLLDAPSNLSRALVDRPFDTDQLMQDIVDQTAVTLEAEVCSLWLVDSQGKNLVHQANFGFRGPKGMVPSYRIDLTPPATDEGDSRIKGITAWVAIRRKAFWANSYQALREHKSYAGLWDPSMYGGQEEAARQFRSMYATPLVWNDELLGVLKVENPKSRAYFSLNDRRMCELMASYVVLLLALTKQLRFQVLPTLSHNLLGPAAGVAMNLGQLDRELHMSPLDYGHIGLLMDMLKRLALTAMTISRTLVGEVEARVGGQAAVAVNLGSFLRQQIDFMVPIAPGNVRLELLGADEAPTLMLRPLEQTWLAIVAFNLLHNAIKHSPPGGVITLRCERDPSAGTLTVSVGDRGSGVPPENREIIFEPGVKTSVPGWPEGTGLGLYEVRRLLTRLGWSIRVRDNAPGALFVITAHDGAEE